MLVDLLSDWRQLALQDQPILWQRGERPERGYREPGKPQPPVVPPESRQKDGGILWTRRSPEIIVSRAAPVLREGRVPADDSPVIGKYHRRQSDNPSIDISISFI